MKSTTPFIFILVAIGLYYTVISPHYAKVKELQSEAGQYSEVLDNVDELSQKRDELLMKYNQIPKAEISRIEKALPDNIDSVRLALDFDSIAAKYGISLKSIKTGDKTQQQPDMGSGIIAAAPTNVYESAPVMITFVSSYENFRKFMKDIESSLRIIDVKAVNFTSTDTKLYEFTVTFETFWLK